MQSTNSKFDSNLMKFGVEIECFSTTDPEKMTTILNNLPTIQCLSTVSYNHIDSYTSWKICTDSSIKPYGNETEIQFDQRIHELTNPVTGEFNEHNTLLHPMEIVSPVLIGNEGLDQLKTVLSTLNELNFQSNDSCSVHVHIDASDFTVKQIQNIIASYSRYQMTIDTFMTQDRINNYYAMPYSDTLLNAWTQLNTTSESNLDSVTSSRYYAVNLQSFCKHGTVEFRQHNASFDYLDISTWVTFVAAMMYDAQTRRSSATMPVNSTQLKSDDFMNLMDRLCSLGMSLDTRKALASKRSQLKRAQAKLDKAHLDLADALLNASCEAQPEISELQLENPNPYPNPTYTNSEDTQTLVFDLAV